MKHGWKVKPDVELPRGYELHEDTTGAYLVTNEDIVATFSHFACPDAIKVAAVRHRNRQRARAESGFTIIELVIVFALILLIIGISIPLYASVRAESQQTAFESQVRALEQAAQMHVISGGGDTIWHAEGGLRAQNPTADHESWMNYFEEYPENPLDTGNFTVEIQDGEVKVSPGVE